MLNVSTLSILALSFLTSSATFANTQKPPTECIQALTGTVVVVDGYSSGKLLAPELRARGYQVVHVQSRGKPLQFQLGSHRASDFHTEIAYDGDFQALLQKLRAYAPRAIMPGAESGVLLADQLSDAFHAEFGLPSNGISAARRDKYLMAETIRAKGVPAVTQMLARSAEEAVEWVRAHHLLPGRVVLKPPASSGSEGVTYCHSEQEIRDAFVRLFGQSTKYLEKNEAVLVQEFLDGIEYVVNTVSLNGRTVVTDIWQYTKRNVAGGGEIYDFDRLLPFRGVIQDQLVAYVLRVVDALGIRTGWGHAEVRMTSRGPVLIEIGSRMMGSGQPQLVQAALGSSQVTTGIDAFLDPARFALAPDGYTLTQHAALVSLAAPLDGQRASHRMDAALRALPGYYRHAFSFAEGAVVPRTVDMDTGLGQIELVHPDAAVLEQSLATIRQWEREGKFLQPEATLPRGI